jgi:hypothetical protein
MSLRQTDTMNREMKAATLIGTLYDPAATKTPTVSAGIKDTPRGVGFVFIRQSPFHLHPSSTVLEEEWHRW